MTDAEIRAYIEERQRGKALIYPHHLVLDVAARFGVPLSEAREHVLAYIRRVMLGSMGEAATPEPEPMSAPLRFKPGDRVRTTDDGKPSALPAGTVGTVKGGAGDWGDYLVEFEGLSVGGVCSVGGWWFANDRDLEPMGKS